MNRSGAARTTLTETVTNQLLDQMRRGDLKPGDRLPPERELMEQFGVGRSTIREVLQSFARMNLIESRPRIGTVIKDFNLNAYMRPDIFALLLTESTAQDLLEAREFMEVTIIGLASRRATADDLVALESILEASREALERNEPTYQLSAMFHVAIARAAHNTVFLNFMQSIYELLQARGRRSVDLPAFLRWEIASHRELYEHIRSGDADGSREAMRAHLRHSAHRLDDIADPKERHRPPSE